MRFRYVPPCPEGFRMGQVGEYHDEEPVHRVVIPHGFLLGETPVTQAQFGGFDGKHESGFDKGKVNPVDTVSCLRAQEFCTWLARNAELPESYAFATLPSEAQWEYACRAGSLTEYGSGDGAGALAEVGHSGGEWDTGHLPVGGKTPNAWNLHDMHGNIWEWCWDRYDSRAYRARVDGVINPVVQPRDATDETEGRVLRGGSWNYSAWFCRAAFRDWDQAGNRSGDAGFRVALFPGPSEAGGREYPRAEGQTGGASEGTERKQPGGTGAGTDLEHPSF